MKKVINLIKENKFFSIVIGIIILTIISQVLFNTPLLTFLFELLPTAIQTILNALVFGVCSAAMVITLVLIGFALDNTIRDFRGLGPREDGVYKTANKLTRWIAIGAGIIVTILILI